ncbi:hypothetical protein ACTFIY_002122 [Dictyostelium cf. discoideum]
MISYEYCDSSDSFYFNDIQDFDFNPWIEVKSVSEKGRCVFSKKFIPKGTMVFRDIPYAAIVDNQFKRNICTTCFKILLESNRHNFQTCPSCFQINYCSNYCKQYSKIETKHTELECKWIQDFTVSFKHQMAEDDRNIVLLILKILARRIYEKQSTIFHNKPLTTNTSETCTSNNNNIDLLPMIPNDIPDLIDHLDYYFINSKNNNEIENEEEQEEQEEEQQEDNNNEKDNENGKEVKKKVIIDDNEKEKEEIKKFNKIWKNDFKRLINIAKVIQIIIDDSINSLENVKCDYGFVDNQGDTEMVDNSIDPKGLDKLVDNLSSSDLNILRLLCKIRANYFGLWNSAYKPIPLNSIDIDDNDNNINNNNKEKSTNNDYLWCGSGVYLKLSLFNHSCFPNCTTLIEYNLNKKNNNSNGNNNNYSYGDTNQLTISIITLRDIEENQELLITYIPLNQKINDRVKSLKSNWLFQCDCKRCHFEKINENQTEKIYKDSCCANQKCSGGLLIPLEQNSTQGICRVCKNTSTLPTVFYPLQ